jgi:hypothetical protein
MSSVAAVAVAVKSLQVQSCQAGFVEDGQGDMFSSYSYISIFATLFCCYSSGFCLLHYICTTIDLVEITLYIVLTMIRLPATTIVLGRADLKDFENRRKYVAEEARIEKALGQDTNPFLPVPRVMPISVRDKSKFGNVEQLAAIETYNPVRSQQTNNEGVSSQLNGNVAPDSQPVPPGINLHTPRSPENIASEPLQPSSVVRDDFEYNGFTETPKYKVLDEGAQLTPEGCATTFPLKQY